MDFSNTVIILTSNIGAHTLLEHCKGDTVPSDVQEEVMSEVKKRFRPEFLNRLDDIVMFRPLQPKDLSFICRNQVALLDDRLAEREINVDVDDAACSAILDASYVPAYGARPVRRYIEKEVVTAISRKIVAGELPNNSTVHIKGSSDRKRLQYEIERHHKRRKTSSVTDDQLYGMPKAETWSM